MHNRQELDSTDAALIRTIRAACHIGFITSAASNAKTKIEARITQHQWYSTFLNEQSHAALSAIDYNYLQTIGTPQKKYFQKALSKDCINYIKGNPLRLLWCYCHLQPFHYNKATLLKWYLKSIRL